MNVQLPDYPAPFWGTNDGRGQSIVYYLQLRWVRVGLGVVGWARLVLCFWLCLGTCSSTRQRSEAQIRNRAETSQV